MKSLVYTNQFKRDYKKRQREKGLDDLLDFIFSNLCEEKSALPIKFRDHALKGDYHGCRECHLKPDLLLVYILTTTEIRLVRLGSHSELFN